MPSTRVLVTAREAILLKSGKSSWATHVTNIQFVDPNPLAPPAADTGTRATPALAGTPDHLLVGNQDEAYEEYMGYGMRLMRARDALTNDENSKRGRWQYATRVKTDVWGARPALP